MNALNLNSDAEWSDLIRDVCASVGKLTGNVMADKQWPMVESRLRRRLRELNLNSPQEYREHWKKNGLEENNYLTGLLTTHFTSFFREFPHFEWIAQELPNMIREARREGRTTLKFWSAAASKGQEVWSLCMWLAHHVPKIDPKMDWIVLGTDIDEVSIREGENAVYHRREIETIPRHLWEEHWVRGKDDISDWYKVKSSLKAHARFKTMNLLNVSHPSNEKFDLIICRNVLIYFDRANQEKIANSLLRHLSPGGTLISGMSESLSGFGLPIKGVAPSIYKPASADKETFTVSSALSASGPIRVLCVDDSPTIISILKKILAPPEFEVVGVAYNGEEALKKVRELRPDAITLDLHMPVMDGVSFLKASGIARELPVIVVSSVERDHAQMVSPLEGLGVIDFVGKPTLSNIDEIKDELTQKLKIGVKMKKVPSSASPFKKESVPESRRRSGHIVFNFSMSDKQNLFHVLSQQNWKGDELSFVLNGSSQEMDQLKSLLRPYIKDAMKVNYRRTSEGKPSARTSVWLHFRNGDSSILKYCKEDKAFMVLEESSRPSSHIQNIVTEISPATSFAYLVDKFLKC